MGRSFQITFDCLSVDAQASFWAAALGYQIEPPPDGAVSWVEFFESRGLPAPEPDSFALLSDPDGAGPRLYLQRVAEPKAAKNRMHLDIEVPAADRRAEIDRLVRLGATEGSEHTMNPDDPDAYWVVMRDPEGNEFCIGG